MFTCKCLITLMASFISVTSSFIKCSKSSSFVWSLNYWKYEIRIAIDNHQIYLVFSCFKSLFLSASCDFHSDKFLTWMQTDLVMMIRWRERGEFVCNNINSRVFKIGNFLIFLTTYLSWLLLIVTIIWPEMF